MYGVGGHPPQRGIVRWEDRSTTVDYPPVALYELAATGFVYETFSPSFRNTRWLNVAIKFPGLLAELALTWLLYRHATRRYGPRHGRWAVSAYWLNPAMILGGAVLGYLDPLMALPTIWALTAASAGSAVAAGALIATACLTKVQAVFVLPVVALGLWNASTGQRAWSSVHAVLSGVVVCFLVVLPYALTGAERNLLQGVGSLLRHDMLSADAANLWWIVTYVMRASYGVSALGFWSAWTMRLRILDMSTIVRLGFPNPRPAATASVAAAAAWALWRARRATDLSLLCALGALIVHAYFVLGVAVHENHLYLAIPLLAMAASGRAALRPICYAVSAVAALNFFLFFGFGRDFPLPPRNFTIVDATVPLALANCAILVWHTRVFSRECSRPAAAVNADDGRAPGQGGETLSARLV